MERHDQESTSPEASPGDENRTKVSDMTRPSVVAAVLFIAGGWYWMTSVGLLTLSALTAYPTVIWVGATLLASTMLYASYWTCGAACPGHADRADDSLMSTYDSVTGLPTNRLFTSLLKQTLSRAQKHDRQVALLLIELDHFRLTAEVDGQVNCNLIYRVQAARVKSALRTTDTVARLSERRFIVLLDQVTSPVEVVAIAKKMQATISLPITLDKHELFLTSRIGISLSAYDGVECNALVRAATQAVATARAEDYVIYGLHGAVVTSHVDAASTVAA